MTANTGHRLIDREERTRKKPMKILVLGLCRTGTSSISAALRKLGYTPHHMREVFANPWQTPIWHEAINVTLLPPSKRPSNQRSLPPYGREEFDKLLGEYDAVTDLPAAIFVEPLVEAYPDAKVILTLRNYESWERSMQNSIWKLFTWKLFQLVRILNISKFGPLMRMTQAGFEVLNGNSYGGPKSKAGFEAHNDLVRRVVPKDRLLEFGPDFRWEPLCEFLGEEVPKGEYPRLNESKAMQDALVILRLPAQLRFHGP
ncbi:hypothetical protein K469DRAFT_693120 [Zopfia rhizophila CBS 207.26]|uniref:P-loop containing nucleoside triphosphate hydrolase protein n=1 Tax=Zopfia rhizophila CBS 207.26 TaxID=1314779 RepID=A0A6A6EPZ9_9PEZI|nr:hypothetical protein K469DRAFT_693120 [Zopfia rhizophila CBS 207.26]